MSSCETFGMTFLFCTAGSGPRIGYCRSDANELCLGRTAGSFAFMNA